MVFQAKSAQNVFGGRVPPGPAVGAECRGKGHGDREGREKARGGEWRKLEGRDDPLREVSRCAPGMLSIPITVQRSSILTCRPEDNDVVAFAEKTN